MPEHICAICQATEPADLNVGWYVVTMTGPEGEEVGPVDFCGMEHLAVWACDAIAPDGAPF